MKALNVTEGESTMKNQKTKLRLRPETLRDLSTEQLSLGKGGWPYPSENNQCKQDTRDIPCMPTILC